MSAIQRKAYLKKDGFIQHKKNGRGSTAIFSRKHPTAKFVRVVVDSGVDAKTGKVAANASVKLCYVNRQKQWREITTQTFTDAKGLAGAIQKVEAAEKFVKTCKHCKAKKFTAKTGNVVCSNACWTAWGGKKKSQTGSVPPPSLIAGRKKAAKRHKKKSQKVTPKSQRTYPANKSSQKSSQKKRQKIVAEILPGDLVSVEEIELDKITNDFTGSILGIVMKADHHGKVDVNWTANTSNLPEWDMPFTDHYQGGQRRTYRFKVLSRSVEWAKAT
jgi:hypothetical protein